MVQNGTGRFYQKTVNLPRIKQPPHAHQPETENKITIKRKIMKHLKILFALLCAIVCCQSARAEEVVIDGIKYWLDDNNVATVVSNDYSGDIVIPATVSYENVSYNVTALGDECFRDCSSLTSVTMPEGVTSLGTRCFYGCSSLTSVTIPESATSLGEWCFYGSSLTSVTIPESVTSLGDYCFYGCSSLTSVTIPESVTTLGTSCFCNCPGLTNMQVAEGNSVYDSRDNCNAIIETASNTMLAGCKNTVIPTTVTSLGDYCFSGCSSLTSVTIPESVTSLSSWCFYGCSSLTKMQVAEGNSVYDSRENCNAIIETASNTMVAGCKNTVIPTTVTSLGIACFYGCSSLTSITIPESVTSLDRRCFSGCF